MPDQYKKLIDNSKVTVTLSILLLFLFIILINRLNLFPNSISIDLVTPSYEDTYQLFYDKGNGFNETDSIKTIVKESKNTVKIDFFEVPFNEIKSIRIDPGTKDGYIRIKSISINHNFHRLKLSIPLYKWSINSILTDFKPLNNMLPFNSKGNLLEITSNGNDPYFAYTGDLNILYPAINKKIIFIKILFYASGLILSIIVFFILNYTEFRKTRIHKTLEEIFSDITDAVKDIINSFNVSYFFKVKIKEKNAILSIMSFFIFFLFFFLRNHYYLPSNLEITGYFDKPVEARISWDSGSGFNDHEQVTVKPGEVPLENSMHKIEIQRTGEKNPMAKSDEVWILNMSTDKEDNIDLKTIEIKDKTVIKENGELVLLTDGVTVTYNGEFCNIKITFLMHTYSGKVRIFIDGIENQILDLYSETGENKTVEIKSKFISAKGVSSLIQALPQYKIKSLKIETLNPEDKIKLEAVKISSANGEVLLPVSQDEYISQKIFQDIDLKTIKLHPVLFIIQLLLALFLAYLFYYFLSLPKRYNRQTWLSTTKYIFIEEKHWIFWTMFFISFLVFSLWLLGQWPGMMTPDSLDAWHQTKILKFTNWHPYLYAMFILVLTQFYNSPSIIALFQILISSVLGSYIFYFIIKQGLHYILVIPFFIAFILSPVIGVYNITLWKDIPFSILVIFWAFYIYYLYLKKISYTSSDISLKSIFILSIFFILLCILRHNGIVYIFFIPLIIKLFNLMSRKRYYQFLFFSFLFYIILQYGIANILEVHKNTNLSKMSLFMELNPIGALVSHNYYSDNYEQDRIIFEKLINIEEAKKVYDPRSVMPIYENKTLNKDISQYDLDKIKLLLIKRILENIPIFLSDRTHWFFSILQESCICGNNLRYNDYINYINVFNLHYSPKIIFLSTIQEKILDKTLIYRGILEGRFIFANALWGFMIIIFIILLYHYLPVSSLSCSIPLYQIFFLFLLWSGNDFRYIYFIYLFSFFIIPLVLLEFKVKYMNNKKFSNLERITIK